MMNYMTLREICNSSKVSRRAIQGYEKAGLICASGKNERGYLLYDTDTLNRIKQIKLYQQLGFTIKEIKNMIDAPNTVLKIVLENQMVKLKKEKNDLETLLDEADELIKKLS